MQKAWSRTSTYSAGGGAGGGDVEGVRARMSNYYTNRKNKVQHYMSLVCGLALVGAISWVMRSAAAWARLSCLRSTWLVSLVSRAALELHLPLLFRQHLRQ